MDILYAISNCSVFLCWLKISHMIDLQFLHLFLILLQSWTGTVYIFHHSTDIIPSRYTSFYLTWYWVYTVYFSHHSTWYLPGNFTYAFPLSSGLYRYIRLSYIFPHSIWCYSLCLVLYQVDTYISFIISLILQEVCNI